ncbi:MAG: 2-oxoacid:acceptor oxidoreductase subunit alpha [Thermaerobacter sp.]|nr:2-oxoacid:acceptor oxidoreductase subunit alpha [Thermaerobacter sp.]
MRLIQGNEAVALGAIAAGCDFYAGYPITPATEIMEQMARILPSRGGVFIQMEDELSAAAAVIGAAWGGARAMTATSGPGFSLMQEHIGYAAMTQTPCVIVDSQRGGPSTGLPTLPAQGEVMQARFGSHGDRIAIVLTASSVRSAYEMTARAFELAEIYRQPIIVLLDAVLSHMRENVDLPEVTPAVRPKPVPGDAFQPFGDNPFVPFGEGYRSVVTGLAHDESGLPNTAGGKAAERMMRALEDRLRRDARKITHYTTHALEGAKVVVLSYGITARAAREAVELLRSRGVPAGLLDLQTLWPFPDWLVQEIAAQADAILVPELNLGQLVMPVQAAAQGRCRIEPLGRADGNLFTPEEIADAARSLLAEKEGGVLHG